MNIKFPREDGAWYMALTCWLCGWAAALKFAWEPLVVAAAVLALFVAAQALRVFVRLRALDPRAAWRNFNVVCMAALIPCAAFAVLLVRAPHPAWIAAVTLPGLLYAPYILFGAERKPLARIHAMIAFTAVAPVTHALAIGEFNAVSAILWAALAGYYLLGGIFIMARLRRSPPALWIARLLASLAVVGAVLCSSHGGAHSILAVAFAFLAARAWLFRFTPEPVNPRRVGTFELVYSSLSAIVVLLAIWLR